MALVEEKMHEVFNMGCGFTVVVPENDEARGLGLLGAHYPAAARIGRVTDDSGHVARY